MIFDGLYTSSAPKVTGIQRAEGRDSAAGVRLSGRLMSLLRLVGLLRNRKIFVTAMFLVAFAIRAGFALTRVNHFSFPDSFRYHTVAINLLRGRGIVLDEQNKALYEPGYPVFLAGCYRLFGRHLLPIRLVQALIGAITSILILYLGRTIFGDTAGKIAALLSCFYPFFVFFSAFVLTETVFTFLLVAGMLCLAKLRNGSDRRMVVPAGLFLGGAALVRSSLVLFLPFLFPFWLVSSGERLGALRSFLSVGLFCFLTMLPWGFRNQALLGHFILTNTRGGGVLLQGNSPQATGGIVSVDWPQEVWRMGEYERDQWLKNLAFRYIGDHPGRFFKLAPVKFSKMWNVLLNSEEYRGWKYSLISLCSYGVVMPLALLGAWFSRKRWRKWIILIVPVLYFSLVHVVFFGSVRFRIPTMPFVILLAGQGIFLLGQGKFQALTEGTDVWLREGRRSLT